MESLERDYRLQQDRFGERLRPRTTLGTGFPSGHQVFLPLAHASLASKKALCSKKSRFLHSNSFSYWSIKP